MENINFKPIFDYIDEAKKEIIEEITENVTRDMATKKSVDTLQRSVDAFAGESKKKGQEEIVLKAKTERIEHWVIDASKKIDLPYQV